MQVKEERQGTSSIVTYLKTPFFNVYEWQVSGKLSLKAQAPYTLMTVIDGAGKLVIDGKEYEMEAGSSCIIPAGIKEWQLLGAMNLIASEPGND